MASRARALLRKWFGRGQYPSAEQFSDVFDSFVHKSEDRIPIGNVEGLPDALNNKYGAADGKELEKRVQKVSDDLGVHEAAAEKEFNNIQNDLEALDGRITTEVGRSTTEDQRLDKAIKDEATRATTAEASIRKDLTDQIATKVDKVTGKGLSTEDYTSDEKSKLAGVATGANKYIHPSSHPATMIDQDNMHQFVSDEEKSRWTNKADKTEATPSVSGLMSAADKTKLNGVETGANKYVHPVSHPAAMIAESTTRRFVTDAEKTKWNSTKGAVPSLAWKLENGQLWVKPSCSLDDPILRECKVGILRLKNQRYRFRKDKTPRVICKKYVIVDSGEGIGNVTLPSWAPRFLTPVQFDADQAKLNGGWFLVATANDIIYRFVEKKEVDGWVNRIRYTMHIGNRVIDAYPHGYKDGKQRETAALKLGVVLFIKGDSCRIEGPHSYFKAWISNSFQDPRFQ